MVSFNTSKNTVRTYVPNSNGQPRNTPWTKVQPHSTTRREIPDIHVHMHKQAAKHLANAEIHYQKAATLAATFRQIMAMPQRRTAGRFTITSGPPSRSMGSSFVSNIQKANAHMNRAKNLIQFMNFANLKNKANTLTATSKRLHANARRMGNRNRLR